MENGNSPKGSLGPRPGPNDLGLTPVFVESQRRCVCACLRRMGAVLSLINAMTRNYLMC